MNRFLARCVLPVVLPVLLLGAASGASAEVNYQLRISNAAQHLAEVKATFPVTNARGLDVQLPNWRTGRYQMLNLANGVRQFSAVNAKGDKLPAKKTDKGTWHIDSAPGDAVTVSYEVYANVLGERTRHIDDTHAYLDASGVFVYAAPFRAEPVKIALSVPQGWQSRSGMESGACAHCFVAADYDQLVDSPIETGEHTFDSFSVDGRTIEVAIWGKGDYDAKKISTDFKKIVEQTGKLFAGQWPFRRYLFIVHATDGASGATEHVNSTVIQRPRWSFATRKGYLSFLRTTAHEFFHTWNVKAYRPREMVPYDYQHENYSRMLWIAEGNTSYFDQLIVLRAGLQTRKEYLENQAELVDDYLHQPGRFEQSASEASFDEWIAVGGERARNAQVNIYSKGNVLAMMIDIELRRQTKGARGLEHVHRALYESNKVSQGGYDERAVQDALRKVSGQDWSQWWQRYVDGMEEIPFERLLASMGMQRHTDVGKDEDQKEEWWAGWRVREASDPVQITEVERNSPAWKAGVVAGDTLLAVNGVKVTAKDLAQKMVLFKTAPLKLHLFRRDQLRELDLEPVLQAKGKPRYKALDNVSDEQKALNAAWLGVAWPKAPAAPAEP